MKMKKYAKYRRQNHLKLELQEIGCWFNIHILYADVMNNWDIIVKGPIDII